MPKLVQKSGYIKGERNMDETQGREQYLKYMATRPRVERHGEHGLFSSAPSVSLDAALHELEEYDGNVYTFIYSLRREDAERLGYDHAEAWRTLICGKQVELATAMNIPPDKLRWYGAFHDEGHHPHIHMMVWSDDPKQGYLTKGGIEKMRSELTTTIFQDELLNLYQEKDMSYKEVAQAARNAMRELVSEMKESICDAPEIEQQLVMLSESLASAKGKKQYQYLKKDVKQQVDAIVDALSELPQVAECYEAWNRCKDALDNYYHDRERERKPLSQQPEFRAIKNMVIREADDVRRNVFTLCSRLRMRTWSMKWKMKMNLRKRTTAQRTSSMTTTRAEKKKRKRSPHWKNLRTRAVATRRICSARRGAMVSALRHGTKKRKSGSVSRQSKGTTSRSTRSARC